MTVRSLSPAPTLPSTSSSSSSPSSSFSSFSSPHPASSTLSTLPLRVLGHSLIFPSSSSNKLNSSIDYYASLTKFNRDNFIKTCCRGMLPKADSYIENNVSSPVLFVSSFVFCSTKINVLKTNTKLFPMQTELDIVN